MAACLLGACATTPSGDSSTLGKYRSPLEAVQMAPFYFEGGANGLDIYTDTDLFRRAADSYDAGDWKAAFNIYRKIIDKFPGSDYRILAFFNAGLCLEQLSEYPKAAEYFLATRELTPGDAALGRDIGTHLGTVYERMSLWNEAQAVFEQVSEREDISEEDRYQFLSRAKVAAAYADSGNGGLEDLESFIDQYQRFLAKRSDIDNEWLARARFSMGEVYFRRFRAITLQLPQEKLQADLEDKAAELLRAQSQFMRTLQIKNAEWATAAVYRIGLGYEEFYHALNNAPVPTDLDDLERTVYIQELRVATEPVRKKAIVAYDRIIAFSNRLTIRTEWVEKARQRVVELRTLGRFTEPENASVR